MSEQATDTVLMVRPASFGSNPETSASNVFQHADGLDPTTVGELARQEFDAAADVLRDAGVRVLVVDDPPEPRRPDAVFPNNWFSTHADGRAMLYPMLAPVRRRERRPDMLERLASEHGLDLRILDSWLVRAFENKGEYLEGTGSLVLDRANKVAYAARSARTHKAPFEAFCARMGYTGVLFDATDADGTPYYHTNVVMCVGAGVGVVCLEAVDEHDRDRVRTSLESTGHALVEITRAQVLDFVGNMLELRSTSGDRLMAMSTTAHDALTDAQREALNSDGVRLVHAPIPTIEHVGGGSLRCMLAEIFLPRASS
ncbi:MAG: arginine deiminase-related protein [Phycisphaerales bacterium]